MLNQDQDYLSVSLTEQSVKVAQVKSSGVVVKVVRKEVSSASVEAFTSQLSAALKGFNTKKMRVLCVIPASVATTKNIEVPSVDPEEIKSIINLQAARHTPLSREEILVGHINLGSYQTNYTKVLLVIVNRSVVRDRLKVLEGVGLDVYKVVFEPEGIARFYAKAMASRKDSAPVGIIDVGPMSTTLVIQSRLTAVMCRSIPIGTGELGFGGAETRDKLVAEIKTSLDSYREEDVDKQPANFVLTSAQTIVKDLQQSLAAAVGVPIQVSPFIDLVKFGGGLKKTVEKDFAEDSLTDILAVAATEPRCEVNLMPEEILLKRNVERQSREAMVAGVLVVLILFLAGFILGAKNYFKETFLKQNLKAKFSGQHEKVLALEDEMRKTKLIRGILDSRLNSLEALRGLYAVVPNDIYLNSVNQSEDGLITINGIAETTSRVYAFVSTLSESKIFNGVKTKSTSGKKDRGKDMIAFEIEFVLNQGDGNEAEVQELSSPKVAGVAGT
ncbi:MAG: pilus assembly protein PilM [Candidatus Omnitrophica bacterium]|nr:pilus assembly protein PilM [Candidatus Omnitrophota bacterium]